MGGRTIWLIAVAANLANLPKSDKVPSITRPTSAIGFFTERPFVSYMFYTVKHTDEGFLSIGKMAI